MSNISLGLVIGATLASSFGNTIESVTKSVTQLQEKSEPIFRKQKIGQAYLNLQKEIEITGSKFEATGYKSIELGRKMIELEQSMYLTGAEAKATGFDLGNIGDEMRKTTIQTQKLERAMLRMQQVAARKAEIASLRTELVGYWGAGYMLMRSFNKAVETESRQFRLGTVINVNPKDKAEAMRKAKIAAADVAKSGLTGFNEALNIQYALNSAGLSAQIARTATPVVAAVAKLTGGMQEQVGEVLATNYNNLGSKLKGTESEKFARIGDLLTKVQYKYQIRDFNQLGEGMKYAATAVNQYNVNLEQSYTAMGELNSAGLQGGMAGTGFNAMMRQLQIGASKGLVSIKRTKDGQIDLVKTLEMVKKKTDRMNFDDKATFIQELAGDEGSRAMVPLLMRLDTYKRNVEEVSKTSKGLVNKGITDWEKTSEAGLMKLNGAIQVTSYSLKEGFLPAIGDIATTIAPAVSAFGTWAQKNPETVKMIGSVIAGLYGMKAGIIIARILALSLTNAFSALVAHPIVFGLVAIGVVAYKIWQNWDFLKGKLLQFWDGIKNTWSSIGSTLQGFFSPFFTWIGKKVDWIVGKWTSFKNFLSLENDVSEGSASNKVTPEVSMPGHAIGGIFDKPHIAAISEGGKKEAIVQLEGNKERARSIHTYVGKELGVTQPYSIMKQLRLTVKNKDKPEKTKSIYSDSGFGNNISKQPNNGSAHVINATFTINASSGSDGEKIARYVKQALADLERKAKSRERGRLTDAPVFG